MRGKIDDSTGKKTARLFHRAVDDPFGQCEIYHLFLYIVKLKKKRPGFFTGQGENMSRQHTADGKQGKAKRFKDLEVWQKAHELVLKIYGITKDYPSEEKFGIVSQMRRSAVSIPANIAEGFKKRGVKDKSNFYNIAQGSLEELRYYLILSKDLGFCEDTNEVHELIDIVGKMLYGLVRSIQ